MYSSTVIQPDTIQGYLETEYHVQGDTPFTLRIGQASAELIIGQKQLSTDCSAFLTAFNPYSRILSASANAEKHQALAHDLTQRGFFFLEGIGQHPSNQWPGEHAYLVFGLSLKEAKNLGVHFEQNALVWSDAKGVPQLILLR